MNDRTRVGLAVALFAVSILIAVLLPARWSCPPMGYCPTPPYDLNASMRFVVLLLAGSVDIALLAPLIRRRFSLKR